MTLDSSSLVEIKSIIRYFLAIYIIYTVITLMSIATLFGIYFMYGFVLLSLIFGGLLIRRASKDNVIVQVISKRTQ